MPFSYWPIEANIHKYSGVWLLINVYINVNYFLNTRYGFDIKTITRKNQLI